MIATVGLLLIAFSGVVGAIGLFYPGIAVLGFGTGIATVPNLSLMLDMTTAEQAGLFIGEWGVADALSRGLGTLMGGVVRDGVIAITDNVTAGYVSVFTIEAGFLIVSLMLLSQIDVSRFRENRPTFTELTALVGDA